MKTRSRIALHVPLLIVMVIALVAPVLAPPVEAQTATPTPTPTTLDSWAGDFWVYSRANMLYPDTAEGIFTTDGLNSCDTNNFVNLNDDPQEAGYVEYRYVGHSGQVFVITHIDIAWRGIQIGIEYADEDGNYLSQSYSAVSGFWQCQSNFDDDIAEEATIGFKLAANAAPSRVRLTGYWRGNPSQPTATALPPMPTVCVTVTPTPPATAQRTPTPFRLTPGATSTPVGTPTPTPPPSFDSGLATFEQSLSPWTVSDPNYLGIYKTEWQSTPGADGAPGLAYLRDYIGWLEPTPAVLTSTAPITGALTYTRLQGFSLPLRVTGQAKWAEATLQGETAYIRIWYFDPNYEGVGHGAWVMAPPDWIAVDGSAWRNFSYAVTQHGGSGLITAIAITEELVDAVNPTHSGVQLDNLRIYSGPLAVSASFPVCAGTGGSGKPPVAIKQCKVNALVTNVYAGCTVPTDTLDLAGWISYYFCRLWHYLWFVNENRAQITDILDRQNSNEPIGTLNEMDDVLGELYGTVSSISAVYSGNDYYTVDWDSLFSGWDDFDFDNITSDWQTTPEPINQQEVLSACPSTFANAQNSDIRKSACFISWVLKVKLRWWVLLQYALDASAIIFAITHIMDWLGQHG